MHPEGPGAGAPDDSGDTPEDAPEYVPLGPADPGRVASFAALADLDEEHDPGPLTQAVEAVGVAPPVVAVIVTHDAGEWLTETLRAFADQTYPNLSVLVIDAGSAIDPTPRVASVMPGAFVRRLDHNPGFGPALNEVLDLVEGASFLCLCHDDVAPDPDAVQVLVEEAFRSNAGIVGPKLVDWDDPDVLLQVGLAVDLTGSASPYAERGELDQEQHDAVRDVFTVPGGFTLVRADLFSHLGGFDPSLDLIGEDLDLSWRAHLVGARVVVAPAARVRHLEAIAERRPDLDVVGLAAQHRVRTMLACTGRWRMLRTVPQALAVSALEAAVCVLTGRGAEARAILAAWPSAVRRSGAIRAVRRRMRPLREVRDADVADLQIRASARILGGLQARHNVPEHRLEAARRRDESRRQRREDWSPLVMWALVAVLLLGTRDLLFGDIPAFGDLARMSSGPVDLLTSFGRSWRDVGVGSISPQPTAVAFFGVLGAVFTGAMGLLRHVVLLAMIPIGVWGAWRLARPLGSRRAQTAAAVVYAAAPVGYNALSQGRLAGLAMTAAAPWLVAALGRSTNVAPFGRRSERGDVVPEPRPGAPTRPRRWWAQSLGLGIGLAVVAIWAPVAVLVVALVAVALAAGSLLALRPAGSARSVLIVVGAAVVAGLLHLPWTLGYLADGAQWAAAVGPRAAEGRGLGLGDLLRFDTGRFGNTPLTYALPVAGLLPLLMGRGWRFSWAVRAWAVALACWGVVWAGQAGWLRIALPLPEVLLAPVAAALALAVALGVSAFEVDLPAYRFGWRQGASALAALAVVVGTLPLLASSVGGRWKVPGGDMAQAVPFIAQDREAQSFRVLWVGDPEVLPAGGWRLDDRISYATSNQGEPRFTEVLPAAAPGPSRHLGRAIDLAMEGQTTRLGRILAPMGVRYIVVPSRLVPLPYAGVDHPPPARLPAALAAQLDLREVPANPAVTVYLNTAWAPQPRLLPVDTPRNGSPLEPAVQPSDGTGVMAGPDSLDRRGRLERPGVVSTDDPVDDGWDLTVDGQDARRVTLDGWRQGFVVARPGDAELSRSLPSGRLALVGVEVVLWVVVVELWRRGHRGGPTFVTDAGTEQEPEGEDVETVVAGGPHAGDAMQGPIRVGERADDEAPA